MAETRGTFPCPACGAEVPEGALSCRACGSDAETGWKEQDLDLEPQDDDQRYDDFVREEFEGKPVDLSGSSPYAFWLTVAGIAALAILLAWLTMPRSR